MIDLRSDTVTKPTEEMRKAMYSAEVGDDVYKEDPTVRELEETAAEILGKEAALFVTSGTQGNQIAVLTHCRPGQELLLEEESHIFYYESGAVAALAGVQTRTIPGLRGAMEPEDVLNAIRTEDIHYPETGLICLENTHNRAGGAVIPVENMEAIYSIAQANKVPVHLDGARLFNAAAAAGVDVKEFAKYTDTVQICLSKGLGAPVGSIIAGNPEFITTARKWRKRLGGGMRQAGVIAAPGLIALTKMKDRLGEDQWNARILAEAIEAIPGMKLARQPETNIVVADVEGLNITSDVFVERLRSEGVISGTFGPTFVRFVTHYDVTEDQIQKAIDAIAKVARQ
ncbi:MULTISPECIES: low-specificity L-threonine aldolase [unclassified Bacillus (in: firmicutes)]|jgi:threonine aldolase|uniref:low-specificity L-threonine aldolase n=1 Tax=unclassified Bacillus (in: firmicutes) TaxID=185979 RepID=UPI001BEC535A|nr:MULTISPECIES: low-specificity L-threonine aldolase [unclassified Bacillus (in: firmicutes)]MBT2685561.1 low-specificity L-threonine aldolase [Bacillus sp. ISL-37]MBT2693778.1 low-specificity L-threonine aldolase [Bacillus sp. ISL-55]